MSISSLFVYQMNISWKQPNKEPFEVLYLGNNLTKNYFEFSVCQDIVQFAKVQRATIGVH